MADKTKIEWCDATFNPWVGCTRVSPGCVHCYAETMMDKRWGKATWGPAGARIRTSADYWTQPVKWNRRAERAGVRRRVFCASLADVFEDKVGQRDQMDGWRLDLFNLIAATPHLDWLLLTKRPENIQPLLRRLPAPHDNVGHFPNVWIGASVEDQERADTRIPELLTVPAAVLFLSVEPLLGPGDIGRWLCGSGMTREAQERGIDWVIVGGESGREARPLPPDWARSIRDQSQEAGVPIFFKQWGEYAPICDDAPMPARKAPRLLTAVRADGTRVHADDPIGQATFMWRAGKQNAGRMIDGREWNEFPVTQEAA